MRVGEILGMPFGSTNKKENNEFLTTVVAHLC